MAYLPRGRLRPPGTSSAAPRHGPGGAAVATGDVIVARTRWQLGRSPVARGAGQCRRTPTSPASWTAVTAGEARCAGRCEGARHRRFFRLSTPVFLRKRCGRPMLPEVRSRVPPSTCRPPTITLDSNTCAKICGVVSYERAPKRCLNGHRLGPHRVVVGWTPCTCATALRPSGATGHRTYLCIVCEAEIFVPPHTGPLFSGVRWPPRQTQEQPRPDSGGE